MTTPTNVERTLPEMQRDLEAAAIKHNAGRKPKFGDSMRNPWASESNPQRDGYFVRSKRVTGRLNPGLWYEMTDGQGKFWEMNGTVALFREAEQARAAMQPADLGITSKQEAALQALADQAQELGMDYGAPSVDSAAVRAALNDYYAALSARQHGGVAADKALRRIEQVAGMSWNGYKKGLAAFAALQPKENGHV